MDNLSRDKLLKLPKAYRAKIINSLSGFKSANLIGTCDSKNNNNLAIFSSVVHLGASPALVGFVVRPDSIERHTLSNIKETGHYTINQIAQEFYQQAHQTSAKYCKAQDEFKEVGLTAIFSKNCLAPFVKESLIRYSVTLQEIVPITLNDTLFVIGEINQIFYPQSAIKTDGHIDIEAFNTVCVSGLDSYHSTTKLNRLSYAKPDQELSILSAVEEVSHE